MGAPLRRRRAKWWLAKGVARTAAVGVVTVLPIEWFSPRSLVRLWFVAWLSPVPLLTQPKTTACTTTSAAATADALGKIG